MNILMQRKQLIAAGAVIRRAATTTTNTTTTTTTNWPTSARILHGDHRQRLLRLTNENASHYSQNAIAAKLPNTSSSLTSTTTNREEATTAAPSPTTFTTSHTAKRLLLFQDAHSSLWATLGSRHIHLSAELYGQASSKVEVTVNSLKEKTEEAKGKTEAAAAATAASAATPPSSATPPGATATAKESSSGSSTATAAVPPPPPATTAPATVAVKKSLKQRIWDEVVHYYHGFRLLGIDVRISCKLLWKTLNGEKLTRRENKLLVRTSSDVFRLVPFSVFIIVPFMELLLPVFIKFFPGMLPSTFQTAKDRDEKLKQNLKVKLEMAKFLQKTLDEMAVQHSDHRSEAAKQFSEFVKRTKDTGALTTGDEILKFSKLFSDEMTLDSLNRDQLMALCRVIDVPTLGTNNFLRFQLQLKLRSLMADDKIIQKEGVDALNLAELQAASRARGMRAYGMSMQQLHTQIEEWISLSVNEKVPPVLLLLSRAMLLPENIPTSDKLKATISALPDSVTTVTKAAIGEREGKIDNRTKIEIIQEEERKIIEEKEEEKEIVREKKEKLEDQAPALDLQAASDELKDKAKVLLDTMATKEKDVDQVAAESRVTMAMAEATKEKTEESEISSQDLEVLSDALGALGKDKKTLLVEKEEIRDLKEEIADYVEDVKELNEVVTPQDQIHESTGAKLLLRKVDSMISKLDKVLEDLEKKERALKEVEGAAAEATGTEKKQEELIHIDELMSMIRKIQKIDDDQKLGSIKKLLGKLDVDQDGHLKVDDLLEMIEAVAKDNVKLSEGQLDELINLMEKEEVLDKERRIQEALKQKQQKVDLTEQESVANRALDEGGKAKSNEMKISSKPVSINLEETVVKEAIEKQNEKILPKMSPGQTSESVLPPPLPKDNQKTKRV